MNINTVRDFCTKISYKNTRSELDLMATPIVSYIPVGVEVERIRSRDMAHSGGKSAFQVESVLSKKVVEGEDFYLVRWLGFGR